MSLSITELQRDQIKLLASLEIAKSAIMSNTNTEANEIVANDLLRAASALVDAIIALQFEVDSFVEDIKIDGFIDDEKIEDQLRMEV